MSKYYKHMTAAHIPKTELLAAARMADVSVSMNDISNYISDVSLPTPKQLDAIYGALDCPALDLYDRKELDLLRDYSPPTRQSRDGVSHQGGSVYNLTIEIDRETAESALSDTVLKKLGYKNKTDFIRKAVRHLMERYNYLVAIEKAARGADTLPNGKT